MSIFRGIFDSNLIDEQKELTKKLRRGRVVRYFKMSLNGNLDVFQILGLRTFFSGKNNGKVPQLSILFEVAASCML